MSAIIKEKIQQVPGLLQESDIDLWLVFVRETPVLADPVLPLISGLDATWQSFLAYTRSGEAIALIGSFDKADYERSGFFTQVLAYTAGVKKDIRTLLKRLDPKSIAINYSTNNPSADGLTHGMYLLLRDYLKGTPYRSRLVSAEELCTKLRSRKTPREITRLTKSVEVAQKAWAKAVDKIRVGMTEVEVARIIDAEMTKLGGVPSFETIVNAGSKTEPGHGHPTDARLEPGDLLHVDFGVKLDYYCSDIQRLLYFRQRGETSPPAELIKAFNKVRDIITESARLCRPGTQGWEVDRSARQRLTQAGYPEYQHALGHQLGRAVHDGGALIGPKWERYGVTPTLKIEAGYVFTLEFEIILPGIGCVGLEEDIVVTEQGGRILGPPQLDLIVK
ncbi:MAG: Xaa-Pro peptidase family protein [candidate division Zixibacteria bacterium]|nr:Xaa-Pro peptidase family protein [candidate division Zixibacteria bacterium]